MPSRYHATASGSAALIRQLVVAVGTCLMLWGCGLAQPRRSPAAAPAAAAAYVWNLPRGLPQPASPPDNPMSAVKVRLGRHLFHDGRLSVNGTLPCAGCHRQEHAFTDGRGHAVGATGEVHPRGAMSLTNVAYNTTHGWADRSLRRLEDQALVPLLNENPIEMGAAGRQDLILQRLRDEPRYTPLFREAFPGDGDPYSLANVSRALACFERTLISGNSAYDRMLFHGEHDALSPAARRGMRLFFSHRLGCASCHSGFNFSAPVVVAGESPPAPEFHRTGAGATGGSEADAGLAAATGKRRHQGRFRAPTLRNIALTAPYMHDGSLPTLESVVEFYASGPRRGARRHRQSRFLHGFILAPGERDDVVAFLGALTDPEFITNPAFASPWRP